MLIAIEGVDGSGKATQTKLLVERLRALGLKVGVLSFPMYGTWHAGFVERFLSGELAEADELDPYVAASFYVLDRLGAREHILSTIAENDIVVSDRYAISNFIHRGVPFLEAGDMDGLDRFYAWLSEFEFDRARIPRPDMTLFLSLGIGNITKLLQKKSEENRTHCNGLDIMERDLAHQAAALRLGHEVLPKYFENYHVVACEDDTQEILSPTNVNDRLFDILVPHLPR